MAAQGSGEPPADEPSLESLIDALDPEVRAAIDDVDRTLIELWLQQSPWERLRSSSRMAQYLVRIRDELHLADEERALLDERLREYRADPESSRPWAEVRAEILKQR